MREAPFFKIRKEHHLPFFAFLDIKHWKLKNCLYSHKHHVCCERSEGRYLRFYDIGRRNLPVVP